jgi:hypothetical protein
VCRSEAPHVRDDVADGDVTFVGVAGRADVADMQGFVTDTGTDAMTHLADEDGSLWARFGVVSQPAYAFIAPDGTVEVFSGALGGAQLRDRTAALAEG